MRIHTEQPAGDRTADDGYLLEVEDLRTYFHSREGTVKAVDGVSFALRRGQSLGIAGESGCGKSVTSQSILRIVPKNGRLVSGRIVYTREGTAIDLAGVDPQSQLMRAVRGGEIAMIFQEPMTSFSPVHTIGNQIADSIIQHQRVPKAEARKRAIAMLGMVGMPKPEENVDAYTFNLSGGMRQRAMIAMALSCRPKLLIADEPTTAVDVTIQAQVLDLIRQFQRELDMALIIITHDLAVIAELADTVLIMYLGKTVEHAPVAELFSQPRHPYTRGLLSSVPRLGAGPRRKRVDKLKPISGAVPSPYEMPSGCLFHPRCPEFMPDVCDRTDPLPQQVGADHRASCLLYGDQAGAADARDTQRNATDGR